MYNRIFNFSAGPAVLPVEVLEIARDEILNYKNSGMSVMEMSHRSKEFEDIIERAERSIRELLKISDDYSVLFLQGGASLQFSMVPMNLVSKGETVSLIQTGAWTQKAQEEAEKICKVNIIASSEDKNFSYLPDISNLHIPEGSAYIHMASNNTIFGTQFKKFPTRGNQPLVCDMSSDILSRPVNVSDFGCIFAGAQKNLGPSGVTLVIIRKDLIEKADKNLPSMLQYRVHHKAGSLYNTPPCYAIYLLGLVADWVKNNGGLLKMKEKNHLKAKILYDAIEKLDFYFCPVHKEDRSDMNVVFRISGADKNETKEKLETLFVSESSKAGLSNLKGHRSVGGLRASIYNAHPEEGVKALVDFMTEFASKNG